MRQVLIQRDFDRWRQAARLLLAAGVRPEAALWTAVEDEQPPLPGLGAAATPVAATAPGDAAAAVRVPRQFMSIAHRVACHRDPLRWDLLYRVLWRITRGGERHLLEVAIDPDVHRLMRMEASVRRDRHKMTAFVRFRRVEREDGQWYVAWHRPDHYIVRLAAPFFARRFAAMRWAILTPDDSAAWDGDRLTFGPGVPASEAPRPDALEALWLTYYASTFNPARVNERAMKKELPVRHWPTLPEAALIPDLLAGAQRRVEEMMASRAKRSEKPAGAALPDAAAAEGEKGTWTCDMAASASAFVPPERDLPALRAAAARCRGCDLYCHATQTVFGEGPAGAAVMLVGEQPGDQEDLAGHPFVGPAGKLLNEALDAAGIDRADCYVTNTVKHFKFEPRGKRRIHAKPSAREVAACTPWLEAEIEAIAPKMIVCLGATAAQALLGRHFRVTQSRGQPIEGQHARWMMATVHPSSLLRIPDADSRKQAYAAFVADLKVAAEQIKSL